MDIIHDQIQLVDTIFVIIYKKNLLYRIDPRCPFLLYFVMNRIKLKIDFEKSKIRPPRSWNIYQQFNN